MTSLRLSPNRLPELSDSLTPETTLVHESLATSGIVHLSDALALNVLVNQDANEADQHDAANNDSNGGASVFIFVFA